MTRWSCTPRRGSLEVSGLRWIDGGILIKSSLVVSRDHWEVLAYHLQPFALQQMMRRIDDALDKLEGAGP